MNYWLIKPAILANFIAWFYVISGTVIAEEKVSLEESIKRGVDFLVQHQNDDGSFGSARKTKGLNIYAPLPDAHQAFHVASTSLALHGIVEAKDSRPEVQQVIKKAEAWLLKQLPEIRNYNRGATYNVWAHAYGLRALSSLYRHTDSLDKKAEYKRQAEIQLKMLLRFEDVRFGWGYYDMDEIKAAQSTGKVNSFTTASCILGLLDAANTMSLELPDKLVQRAKEAILIQRKPDFSYAYEWGHRWVPNNPINKPAGSLARSQACNLALRKLGDKDVTDEVIQTWLARLFKLQGWLDIGRKKPIPHEAPAAISGYFYYYGHYYAAECIHLLPENEQDNWKATEITMKSGA